MKNYNDNWTIHFSLSFIIFTHLHKPKSLTQIQTNNKNVMTEQINVEVSKFLIFYVPTM